MIDTLLVTVMGIYVQIVGFVIESLQFLFYYYTKAETLTSVN
jgi:hypothetical protein